MLMVRELPFYLLSSVVFFLRDVSQEECLIATHLAHTVLFLGMKTRKFNFSKVWGQ